MRTPRTCLILGSGMGGLALGTLLARAGVEVTILEAHPTFVGGYAQTLDFQGYKFAAGPRYLWNFGPGQVGRRFLEKCELAQRVPMVELDRTGFDHIYIEDDEPIRVPNGWTAYGELLKGLFPREAKGLEQFFSMCRRSFQTFEVIDELGLNIDPWSKVLPAVFLRVPKSLAWVLWNRYLTLEQAFNRCGLSRRLRAILLGHSGIFAITEDQVSFHAYVGATLFYHRGCYYPKHDMEGFVGALVETIEGRKGRVLNGQRVFSVASDSRGVQSVRTGTGENFSADAVVVNFDPRQFLSMIRPGTLRRQLPDYQYSHSISSLFLGLDKAECLERHFGPWNNWYLSTEEPIPNLYDADPRGEPKMMYVNSPTLLKGSQTDAPPGGATVTAFAACSYPLVKRATDAEREEMREKQKERMLDVLERRFIPDLRKHVAVAHLRMPFDNERIFHAPEGSIYGRSLEARDVWKKVPFKGLLPNLYFVGAAVCFAGIASVIQGACRVYRELTGDKV